MEKKKYDLVFMFLLILITLFNIGLTIENTTDKPIFGKKSMAIAYSDDCSGQDLRNTSYCLNNKLKEFYNYNMSNAGKKMTEEELKKMGGVCSHYSEWYKSQAEKLGFEVTLVTMPINATMSHEVAIISDDSGYCLEDQTIVTCWRLK